MAGEGVAPNEGGRRSAIPAIVLVAILAAAALLRLYRIDEPIAGYFAFSEGLYLQRALVEAARGPMAWFTDPAFPNVFPLYQLAVTLLERAGALSIATARGVSVAAGLAAIGAVFSLGRRLWGASAGLVAAAVLAFIPGMVLLNHNAQVDSLMVGLVTLMAALYVGSALDDSPRRAVVAGVVAGLAVLAKLPASVAVVVVLVWDVWRTGRFRVVFERRNVVFAAVTAAVGLPWYAWQALASSGEYTSTMSTLGERATGGATAQALRSWAFTEPVGFLSPLAGLALVIAVAFLLTRRDPGDRLVLLWLAAYGAFYLTFHFHSYYLLPLAPPAALGIAAASHALARKRRAIGVSLAVAFVAYMVFASAMMLSGQKWGHWSPVALNGIARDSGIETIYVTERVRGTLGPATELYATDFELHYLPANVVTPSSAGLAEDSSWILSFPLVDSAGRHAPSAFACKNEQVRPVVFGRQFWQTPANGQLFANGAWHSAGAGAPWRFGIEPVTGEALYVLYDPGSL